MKKIKLLTTSNAKTIKGESLGYKTYILYMSPYRDNSSGINLCPHASPECAKLCLNTSGLGGIYNSVQKSRRAKSDYFLNNRIQFLQQLVQEVTNAVKLNEDKAIPVFRLNGTTDIRWEKFTIFDNKNIFELFPDVQFYDYTKNSHRFTTKLPPNYHLTFSRSETNHNEAIKLLSQGHNVAMVFDKLPNKFESYEVINADADDLRFLDKKNVICGLTYKKMTGKGGKEKNQQALQGNFVIKINTTK